MLSSGKLGMTISRCWTVIAAAMCVVGAHAADPVSFANHIQPILQEKCSACHLPAGAQSDLDLTSF
ncbi:MAG: hypothetical protein GY953_25375, partial [bacterium]|nr:hypothetical protein [bacterium]